MYIPATTVEETTKMQIYQRIYSFKKTIEEYLGAKLKCNDCEEICIPDTTVYLPYADKD